MAISYRAERSRTDQSVREDTLRVCLFKTTIACFFASNETVLLTLLPCLCYDNLTLKVPARSHV